MLQPKISIVVPTFRRPEALKETLSVLIRLDYPKESYEIIVVDDGSQDSTPEVVESFQKDFPNLVYKCQENSGVAKARNEGVRLAKGDTIIFNDDDIIVDEPKMIQKHLERLSEFGKCLVCGHWEFSPQMLEFLNETAFGQFRITFEDNSKDGNKKQLLHDNCYQSQTVTPQNLSIRREDFWSIGGFDEQFPYAGCEDHEFVIRAAKAEYKFIYDFDLRLLHNDHRLNVVQFGERQRRGAVTKVLIAHKQPAEEANHPMLVENSFIKKGEPIKISIKKFGKKVLAIPPAFNFLLVLTHSIEQIRKNSFLLPKLYNIVCGIYIFRGIREGIERYGEPKES